jgi:hypothetical protein
MKTEAVWLIDTLERALREEDPDPGWFLQENISRVWNELPPNSEERLKLADIWKRMMSKWH